MTRMGRMACVQGGGVHGAHRAGQRSRMDATTEAVAHLAGLVSPQPSALGAPKPYQV